jgi:hypothetical protein
MDKKDDKTVAMGSSPDAAPRPREDPDATQLYANEPKPAELSTEDAQRVDPNAAQGG